MGRLVNLSRKQPDPSKLMHRVEYADPLLSRYVSMVIWCEDRCEGNWDYKGEPGKMVFWFVNEEDALMFKLTWAP